jgi:hypothetical protein
MIRYFSTPATTALLPLCAMGWQAREARTRSGWTVGNALFDGNYRTSWEHYDVSVRQAMTSSLAYVKGGKDKLPNNLMIPMTTDGRFLHHYIQDVMGASRSQCERLRSVLKGRPTQTIFSRKYDIICPLPSSKGQAAIGNQRITQSMAMALGITAVEPLILRFRPMAVKSTDTDRPLRVDRDAPRLMHYSNMMVNKEFVGDIRGASILLYDDVFTFGNTAEAARNLLLLLGAAEVDVMVCFATGLLYKSTEYGIDRLPDGIDVATALTSSDHMSPELFELVDCRTEQKDVLKWHSHQETLKQWHDLTKAYVRANFPEFVPNDIPWL